MEHYSLVGRFSLIFCFVKVTYLEHIIISSTQGELLRCWVEVKHLNIVSSSWNNGCNYKYIYGIIYDITFNFTISIPTIVISSITRCSSNKIEWVDIRQIWRNAITWKDTLSNSSDFLLFLRRKTHFQAWFSMINFLLAFKIEA